MRRLIMPFAVLAALLLSLVPVYAQQPQYTYGNRPIDSLPKSTHARPEDDLDWGRPDAPAGWELAVHPKDTFRVGEQGVERLCVIEAHGPADIGESGLLVLATPTGDAMHSGPADWVGRYPRMRSYWLPVLCGAAARLSIRDASGTLAEALVTTSRGAPRILYSLEPERPAPEADAGVALLPADSCTAVRGSMVLLRIGLCRGMRTPVSVSLVAGALDTLLGTCTLDPADGQLTGSIRFRAEAERSPMSVVAMDMGEMTMRAFHIHLADPPMEFGARETDLRYTLPVVDGDVTRSWDEVWGESAKRDVVVNFPGQPYRMVFWRGGSYVPCWALPEGWMTYEWLEAEPYFYGADDCVEPLQDRDCIYSRVEIISSTPARAVVKWSYALTDFACKIINNEHAEEVFTLYPDGVGTRYLRGYYGSGWHENQEFIMVNRPGRRASDALHAQALTFHSPDGRSQAAEWPRPGFSLSGWPQVISVVNLGDGPRPFMVTPNAPTQVKVWAEPYLDKPDIFNSYPHWPVTRGMLTSWLDDPVLFANPTHSNLANLVNDPIERADGRNDFLWLIGMEHTPFPEEATEARACGGCWVEPGDLRVTSGATYTGYSQQERAYMLTADAGAESCRLELFPAAGTPVRNPALIINGWSGDASVTVPGAVSVKTGREGDRLVVFVEGTFSGPTAVTVGE